MKTCVFLNKSAGNFNSNLIETISMRLYNKYKELPPIFIYDKTIDSDNFLNEALKYENIIVGGGDGTLRKFAKKIINTNITMGILPIGTANVLARELEIPFDFNKALDVILNGKKESIDVGMANNHLFLTMVSCGIDAQAVQNVNSMEKKLLGSAAYVFEGIETLITYKPQEFIVEIDDNKLETTAYIIIITNTKNYGTGVNLVSNADITDGILDVCIFQKPVLDNFGFLIQVAKTVSKFQIKDNDIKHYSGKNIKIYSKTPVASQLDGDGFGYTPIEVKNLNKALSIFIP